MIPSHLRSARFVKLPKKSKKPFENGWQKKPYSYEETEEWIRSGNNYGVLGGNDGLIILDADTPEVEERARRLSPTLTIRTPKKGGHYYYYCPELTSKIILQKGETHYGEILSRGCQAVGPGSIHPDTGTAYVVENDVPIVSLTLDELLEIFADFIPPNKQVGDMGGNVTGGDIMDVVSRAGIALRRVGGQLIGPHPVHRSTNGSNFSINPDKGVWHCFRCDSGGGILSLIAVLEGCIDCSEALPGGLKGDKYKEAIILAKDKYGISVDTLSKNSVPDAKYTVSNEGLFALRSDRKGNPYLQMLANFSAEIIEELVEDNGMEITHRYRLTGRIQGKNLPVIDVTANSFASLNWLHRWGTQAILEPGQNTKDLFRHATQVLSKNVPRRHIHTHTGWREINDQWAYLSGNGAIGIDDVVVTLPEALRRYALPRIVDREKEEISIVRSLSFLDMGKHELTFPLYALLWLSPLTTILNPMPNFSGYGYGDTGTFKTTAAMLLLCHFGDFTQANNLSNFDDTANAIEKKAFTLKDTLLILDDYHPSSRRQDAQSKEQLAQRLIREYSNRTARDRLNADTTEKGRYTPRGMLLITGEELVQLQSTLARVLVMEFLRGDIDKARLTELQEKADILPYAMTSYIAWVRDHIVDIRGRFPETFRQLRAKASRENTHRKLPEQVAFLQFAFDTMLSWVIDKGVLSEARAGELAQEAWGIFNALSAKQSGRIDDDEPIRKFTDIVQALIIQEKVHIESKDNSIPPSLGGNNGDLIGYYDELHYYLLPQPLWHALQQYCVAEQTHFPLTKETLYRRLANRGLIQTEGGRHTINVRIKGEQKRVLKFITKGIFQNEVTEVTGVPKPHLSMV